MGVRVGFIGVGDMGGPIAQRIIDAGFVTTLWARRPESLDRFEKGTFKRAASKAELGANSDVVGTCVFDDLDLRETALGAHGVLSGMQPGSVLLLHSTNSVDLAREVAEAGADKGVAVLDAPVTGASAGAEAGTLTIMLGGDKAAFERALPVLRSYGELIRLFGPVGSGTRMKVLNNTLSHSNGMLAITAIEIGMQLGLDPTAVVEVLRSGAAQSFSLHNLVTRLVPDPGEFIESAKKMMCKDLGFFVDEREKAGIEPTMIERLCGMRANDPAPQFLKDVIGNTLGRPYSQVPTPLA